MLKASGGERREKARSRRRISVRYGPHGFQHLGFTTDCGETGLFLQGNTLYPPNTILQILVEVPGGGTRTCQGRVRWVKDVPAAFRRTLRGGMGIELMEK